MPDGMKRVFATPLTEMATEAKEELGTIRREGSKTYKYVRFYRAGADADVSVAEGDVVYYDDYDNSRVHADVSAAQSTIAAGVAQAAWAGTVAAGDVYGWVQIKGEADLNTNASGSNGNSLTNGPDRTLAVAATPVQVAYAIMLDNTPGAQKILCTFPF